jgi:hypothetical protein
VQSVPLDGAALGVGLTVRWANHGRRVAITLPCRTGVALQWPSLVAALVYVVLRFRSSRGTERQQMRRVAAGAAAAVIRLLLSVPGVFGRCTKRARVGVGVRAPCGYWDGGSGPMYLPGTGVREGIWAPCS